MSKNEQNKNLTLLKQQVNQNHIEFYDKAFQTLDFILDEFSKELIRAEINFLEVPKNTITTIDFIISSIGKIQKGQRLALGLDENNFEDTAPVINTIEGINESKI